MLRKKLAAGSLLLVLPLAAACNAAADDDTTSTSGTASSSSTASSSGDSDMAEGGRPTEGEPGGSVDTSAVTTEAELVDLIQEAYGDGGLGLHRGHQPVQDVLDEVLTISHDELHVRMEEQGQNLAAIAEDLGTDPQTLVDALVESWSPAIDGLVADGTITDAEAEQYETALAEAFTFRVTWDGEAETPTFAGLDA